MMFDFTQDCSRDFIIHGYLNCCEATDQSNYPSIRKDAYRNFFYLQNVVKLPLMYYE